MPTYDYVCDACGHERAEFQSIKADPLTKCPECGEEKLRRRIGAGAGIIFKGSGFYETDYKRSRSDGAKDGDASSKSNSESKTESSGSSDSSTKSDSASSSKSDSSGSSSGSDSGSK